MLKLSSFLPLHSTLGSLVLVPCVSWVLSGCSIEQVVYEDAKIESDFYQEETTSTDPVDIFIAECNKCVRGDIDKLPELIKTYYSSFTPSNHYEPGQFMYQQIKPTQAFEKCAEKANAMGDKSAFSQLMIRPARIARTARFFYIQKDYRQGAYWIQRLININGEMDGLQVAGRIFIQDMRTIDIGVRLLEQSARLGNREAKQMLLGLMQPGSSYYQSITRNTLLDEERSGSTKDDAAADVTKKVEQEQAAEARAAMAQENAAAAAMPQTPDAASNTAETAPAPQAAPEQAATANAANNAAKATPASTTTPSQTGGAPAQDGAAAVNDAQQLTPEYNLPARKLSEQSQRIQELKARADAAAAAAEKHQSTSQSPQVESEFESMGFDAAEKAVEPEGSAEPAAPAQAPTQDSTVQNSPAQNGSEQTAPAQESSAPASPAP